MNVTHSPEILNALELARHLAGDPRAPQDLSGFGRVAVACLSRYQRQGGAVNRAKAQVLAERLAQVAPGPILSAHWPLGGEG